MPFCISFPASNRYHARGCLLDLGTPTHCVCGQDGPEHNWPATENEKYALLRVHVFERFSRLGRIVKGVAEQFGLGSTSFT
jgi:hypothetical protein